MRRLILTTASVLALGIGGAGFAQAAGYSNESTGAANMPPAQMQQQMTPKMSSRSTRPSTSRASKSEVKQAQEMLRQQGLYRGRIDGVLGPKTKTALRNFQRKNGLRGTASLDQRTLSALSGGGAQSQGSSTQGQGSSMQGSSGNGGAVPMTPQAGQQEQTGNAGAGAVNGAATSSSNAGPGPSTGTQPNQQK